MVVGVQAQLGLAAQAMRAGPAWHAPRQHHVLTRPDRGDVVADLGDDSGALVTERARQQGRYRPVAQRQVAVADAAGAKLHPHFVASQGPQRELLHHCGLPDLAQHHRFHRTESVSHVIATWPAGGTTAPGQGRQEYDGDINDDHDGPDRWRRCGFDDRRPAADRQRGQLRRAQSGPAGRGKVVGHAPAADRAQLDAAVPAARRAAPGWRALGVAERVAAVAAAATTAAEQLTGRDWRAAVHPRARQGAQPRRPSRSAPGRVWPRSLGGMAEAALAPEQVDPQSKYPRLHREPFGVAALVLPFNWPLALTLTKLASALTAGNTTVVKVPPTCPLAALQLAAALAAALPPGVVNVLGGPGTELAQALVTHPGIDLISLTGGVATGRAVMAAAARRLTPVLLELGGNDAAIIASDITVSDELVERLVTATYTTGGQVCMAIKRLYAPRDRVGELAEAVLARCEREVVGDGLADETTLGPLHNAAGRDRVAALVADAEAQGRDGHGPPDGSATPTPTPAETSRCRPSSPIWLPTRRWPPRNNSARCCRSSASTSSTTP